MSTIIIQLQWGRGDGGGVQIKQKRQSYIVTVSHLQSIREDFRGTYLQFSTLESLCSYSLAISDLDNVIPLKGRGVH